VVANSLFARSSTLQTTGLSVCSYLTVIPIGDLLIGTWRERRSGTFD
jgi:hypothetical protein